MRKEWYIDRKKNGGGNPIPFGGKQPKDSVDKVRRNIVDYQYKISSMDIKMRHFVHINLFALKMNGSISLIKPKRGYAIIKKWEHTRDSHNLSIVGNIQDIKIDNIFACGDKIEI